MQPELQSSDLVTRLCPLGVRFWDEVAQQVVADGLTVTAAPKVAWDQGVARLLHNRGWLPYFPILPAAQQVKAKPNRSGIYVFRDLPGLRDVEQAAGDNDFWNGPMGTTKHRFVVAVQDTTGQFLPFTFEVLLPYRGVFDLDCDPGLEPSSPPSPPISALAQIPLFSMASRAVPSGLAVLRADLWDMALQAPAAWAVLRLTIDDPIRGAWHGRGLADDRGCLVALFPYPEPKETYPLSPPYAGLSLLNQSWDVQVETFYSRVAPQAAFPDICKALGQQAGTAATLLQTASPPVALTRATLEYSRELILKSTDSPQSKLFVT